MSTGRDDNRKKKWVEKIKGGKMTTRKIPISRDFTLL